MKYFQYFNKQLENTFDMFLDESKFRININIFQVKNKI